MTLRRSGWEDGGGGRGRKVGRDGTGHIRAILGRAKTKQNSLVERAALTLLPFFLMHIIHVVTRYKPAVLCRCQDTGC